MEARFNSDLSEVRVREAGSEAAPRPGALAWTIGATITFAPGHYAPGDLAGRRLVAHEVAHVLQQRGPGGGLPGPEHEAEAKAAARADGGARVALSSARGAPQCAGPTGSVPPVARRRIVIDANIIGLINRGDADVAKTLLRLRGSADIWITQEGWNSLVESTNPRTSTANRSLLAELGIEVGPPESLTKEGWARRMDVLMKNIDQRQILSEKRKVSAGARGAAPGPGGKGIAAGGDVFAVAHAAAGDAELWSLDRAFNTPNAATQVQNRFGVTIAPESLSVGSKPVLPSEDYKVARSLLGLEEIEIDESGRIVPRTPPKGGGGRGGPPPASSGPTKETPKPVDLPKETPKPVDLPKEPPKPVDLPKEPPKPVDLPKERPKPLDLPTETPKPVALSRETPKAVTLPKAPRPVDLSAPSGSAGPTARVTVPMGDLVEEIPHGQMLRDLFRSIGRILEVVGPIVGIAFEVLDAVGAYSMAMSGLSGRGFVLTREIALVNARRREADDLLEACRAEHEAFMSALSLPVGEGYSERLARLREAIVEEGPTALADIGARRREISQGIDAFTALGREADLKYRVAKAYLETPMPDFGSMNKVQALGAYMDWPRLRSAADAAAAALRAVDAILAEQIAVLRSYAPGLASAGTP